MDGLRAMAMAENWTLVETKVGNVAIQDHPEQMAIGLFGVGALVLVTMVTKGLILLGQGGDRGPAEMT